MTPKQFAVEMRVLAKNIEGGQTKAVRAAALTTLTNVTLATPVDTGRARANWITNIGAPGKGTRPAGSAGASITPGSALINGASIEKPIHITNNLPYIGRLNDGYSKKAPKNFVEISIRAAIRALQKAKII